LIVFIRGSIGFIIIFGKYIVFVGLIAEGVAEGPSGFGLVDAAT
jgi:hypothetical protein